MRAIHDSDLDEKISSLPNGVLTPVYKQFDENGVEFSGGENQKSSPSHEQYIRMHLSYCLMSRLQILILLQSMISIR